MTTKSTTRKRIDIDGDDDGAKARVALIRRAKAQGVKPFSSLVDFAGDPKLTAEFDVDAFLREVREDRDRTSRNDN